VAWANAAWSDALQVRAGQFKMPFSMEELSSSRFLDFQERSLVNRLVPAKERGAMIHGVPFLGATYAVALSNGAGKNNNETAPGADAPDIIGRATLNIAELVGHQARAVYHLGVAGSVGTLPSGTAALGSTATEPRGYAFFLPQAFTGSNVDRQRVGLEGAVAYGPLKFQSEWVQANYKGTSANGVGYDKGIDSYYVRLMWLITGERYAETYRNGLFGQRIVPIQNYTPGGSSWGAWELGLQFSSFDASDFPLTGSTALAGGNPLAGTGTLQSAATGGTLTNRATAVSVGLKWIWTPNFKVYLNYVDTRFDNPIRFTPTGAAAAFTSDRERAVTMRAAFDF
jgi:phosphate-selective porin OprO/OprP